MPLFSEFGKIWVFNSEESAFPGGIFTDKDKAEMWISAHRLSGTLTLYPIDVGVYDLFVSKGWFKPKRPDTVRQRSLAGSLKRRKIMSTIKMVGD